jgi:hypothetical protein
MAQSPELLMKIAEWRARALDGTITPEDMKEAIISLREGRVSACFASAASRAKGGKNPIPSAEELLERLICN